VRREGGTHRAEDPTETCNLATDPAHRELVARYSTLLEDLITAEIGTDTRAWVIERPRLLGRPTWHGDDDRPAAVAAPARRRPASPTPTRVARAGLRSPTRPPPGPEENREPFGVHRDTITG
ncbi:hypothetical protein ACIQOV_11250, partial [Kitasatospora sp. NPDC091257]|uniref:hypothetical protein n=1 Tax=Kitasatospora sp. NPDC091257 TaxID=3364084 RepID=UPI0038124A13